MLPIILILFVVIFLVKFLISSNSEEYKSFEKIPGPKGIPILGNISDYFQTGEERWRRKRARALEFYPIYKLKALNKKIVHLVDPKDVKVILSNSRYSMKGETYEPFKIWLGNGIFLAKDDEWRKGRKLLTKCFHFNALKNNMDLFNNAAVHLATSFRENKEKPSDLFYHLDYHTFKVSLDSFVGDQPEIKDYEAKRFLSSLRTMSKISALKIFLPLVNHVYKFTPLKWKENKALKVYNEFTSYIIEENSKLEITENHDASRVLDVLLRNYEGQSVKDNMNTLMFGGQDTTSSALSFILYVLASKPNFQDEIYKEIIENSSSEMPSYLEINQMNLLDRFIKECFRIYSPAHFVGRSLQEDVCLPSGYTIPAGALIFIDIFDIHRNPKIYPQPEKFDPDRFLPENIRKRHPYSFLPFSAGPRNCIAQKYAMLQIKSTICEILKEFRMEPVGSLEDIVLIPDILLKSKYPLKVIFKPRKI